MKIVLISCASKKLPERAKAKDLYVSQLFKLNLRYACSLNPDRIFILSAKYGLLNPDEEISPYNETLNTKSKQEIKLWADEVLKKLKNVGDLERDEFIFLAGERYRKYLVPNIKNYKIPLKGMGIGKQLKFLKGNTEANRNNRCEQIHQIFSSMKRFTFPFNESKIPKNGIYVLFEKGENSHKKERIVRIGTHTGENQLPSRLKQHFLNENKDRSIFRKNIGRALLNMKKDSFLKQWEIDLTTKDSRKKFSDSINLEKQKQIEKQVSDYIQKNFSFIVFPIKDKEKRLEMESKIISTISKCQECKPSQNWLGKFSPKEKIRKSGLWQVNELYKQPLTYEEINELRRLQ